MSEPTDRAALCAAEQIAVSVRFSGGFEVTTSASHQAGGPCAEPARSPSRPLAGRYDYRGTRRIRRSLAGLTIAALSLGSLFLSTAAAAAAGPDLQITTPYPDVSVAPGSKVSFDLKLTVNETRHVSLALSGVPDGWQAAVRGGGYVVDGVLASPTDSPSVRVDVTVPADARGQTYPLTVKATSGALSDELALSIKVSETAAGSVTLKTGFPLLKGPSSATYRFNLTLNNDTAEDLTFGLTAQGPTGWQVSARPSGQSQAASVQVNAGSSASIEVEADPPSDVEAGQYPIQLTATAGQRTVQGEVAVEITGQFAMTLTTPDGRLNANGQAGSVIRRDLAIQNTGTAPLTGVTLNKTAPTGWNVSFDPPTVDTIAPGQTATVAANITPSSSAIAGDYVVTFTASAEKAASSNVDIRVTVETSLVFGLVGVALIVAVLAGLAWVFQRYGRR